MGIDVSRTKAVSINERHEHGVDTSLAKNPSTGRLGKLPLVHVFSRNRRGTVAGDGNPLIYALKGLQGYSITPHWERWLFRRAVDILAQKPELLSDYQVCIPVPSASLLCSNFAGVAALHLGIPLIVPDFVQKRTIGSVLAGAQLNPPRMRPGQVKEFEKQLEIWAVTDGTAIYKAKEVPTAIRPLFSPLEAAGTAPNLKGQRVLIVDDLFATGSSIESMWNLIEGLNAGPSGALCLLSGNRGR